MRHRPRRHYRTRPAIVAANVAATLALLAVCAAVILTATPPDPGRVCAVIPGSTRLNC